MGEMLLLFVFAHFEGGWTRGVRDGKIGAKGVEQEGGGLFLERTKDGPSRRGPDHFIATSLTDTSHPIFTIVYFEPGFCIEWGTQVILATTNIVVNLYSP